MYFLVQSFIYSYLCIGFTLISASILIEDIFREGNGNPEVTPNRFSIYADGNSSASRVTNRNWTLISPIYVTASGTIVEARSEASKYNSTANPTNDNEAVQDDTRKAPNKRGTTSKRQQTEDEESYDDINSEFLDGDQNNIKNSIVAPRPERKEYDSKSYNDFLKSLSALTNLPVNYNGTAIIVTTGSGDSKNNDTTSNVVPDKKALPAESEEGDGESDKLEIKPESAEAKQERSDRLRLHGVINFPSPPYSSFFNPFPPQPFGSFPYDLAGNPFIGQLYFGTHPINAISQPKNIQNYSYYNPSSFLQPNNPVFNGGFSNYPQSEKNGFSPADITIKQNTPTEFQPNIEATKTVTELPAFRPNFGQMPNPYPSYYFPGYHNSASYQGGLPPVFNQPTAAAIPNVSPVGQDQKNTHPRSNNIGRNTLGLFSLQDYFGGASQQWQTANSVAIEPNSHQELLPLSNAKEGNHKVLSSVTSIDGSNNKRPEKFTNDNPENGSCKEWTTWTKCSQQCGGCGQKRRERVCVGRLEIERKSCHLRACEYPEPVCCEERVPRLVNSVTLCLHA